MREKTYKVVFAANDMLVVLSLTYTSAMNDIILLPYRKDIDRLDVCESMLIRNKYFIIRTN